MTANLEKQLGRRSALVGIGVAAASAAAIFTNAVDAQRAPRGRGGDRDRDGSDPAERADTLAAHRLEGPDQDVRALFGDLRPGHHLGPWRIEALYGVRGGGIPVVLRTRSGERFAVEVFRVGEGAAPLVTAGPLGLYLINRGDGSASTDEAAGLGVIALGRALEARLAAGAEVPDTLTTLDERHRRHPTGIFHVPV